MHRDLPGRLLGGVCSALALQFNVDPVLVRVVFAISLALSVGLTFWAYLMIWVMTPFRPDSHPPARQAIDWVKGVFSKADAESTPKS